MICEISANLKQIYETCGLSTVVLGVCVFRSLADDIYKLYMCVCAFHIGEVVNIVLDLTVQSLLAYASESSSQEMYFLRWGLLLELSYMKLLLFLVTVQFFQLREMH